MLCQVSVQHSKSTGIVWLGHHWNAQLVENSCGAHGGEFLWCTYFIDKLLKFLSSFWNKCLLLDLHALKVFSLWLVICTKRERWGTECLLIVGTFVQRIHCSLIYNGKFPHLVITDPRFVRISLDEFGLSLSISALRPISCSSLYPQQ